MTECINDVAVDSWIFQSVDQKGHTAYLNRDKNRVIEVDMSGRGDVRQAVDQRLVTAAVELVPFTPRAGRLDKNTYVFDVEQVSEQDPSLANNTC